MWCLMESSGVRWSLVDYVVSDGVWQSPFMLNTIKIGPFTLLYTHIGTTRQTSFYKV
jgi:hypothetical protein